MIVCYEPHIPFVVCSYKYEGSLLRIKTASNRTKMVAVFVRSITQSTQCGDSLAAVAHWLLTGITTRVTGVDLSYQMDV